jgi:amino acid adenylation domain-containing protein
LPGDDTSDRMTGLSPAKRALLELRLKQAGIARSSGDLHPLSFAQERLWFLAQLDPDSAAYNRPMDLELRGPLDVAALGRSVREIVRRHHVLRSTVELSGTQPMLRVSPVALERLPVIELGEREARRLAEEHASRPFDLARGPIFRTQLVRISDEHHILLFTVHHIAFDGWSEQVLVQELAALYSGSALPELAAQYPDYAAWQRSWLAGDRLAASLDYWTNQLADAPRVLELPSDRPRSTARSDRGARVPFTLSAPLTAAVLALGRSEGATPFMVLLAAFQTLLHRYTGEDDIVVGSVVANRTRVDTEPLIGLLANTLVMRARFERGCTFRAQLAQVVRTALAAFAHQELPFERLVEALRPERTTRHSPLFQTAFVFQSLRRGATEVQGLSIRPYRTDTGTAKFDLTLEIELADDILAGTLEYSTDLFDRATIERMSGHLVQLLADAVARPDARIAELELLTAAERHRVVVEWNATTRPYPSGSCVHELFEEQARKTPDATAVVFGDRRMTYRELDEASSRVAASLRGESFVGITSTRSLELVVGLLGILKAGAAYVPLDPEYPAERIALLVRQANVRVVLDADAIRSAAQGATGPAARTAGPRSAAYVLFTSGSTGVPKGVCVEHRSIVRLVRSIEWATFAPDDVFLAYAPLTFDASTLEIWAPLTNGGALVIAPPGLLSIDELGALIRAHRITFLWLTSGLFTQVVDHAIDALAGVRQLFAGGDVLSPRHVRRVLAELPQVRLVNGYGPTENTTFTACHPITLRDGDSIPIGRPITNTTVYIVDATGRPAPIGVPGELVTGGDGVARGYLDPDATAERFVPDPFAAVADARMYRTGDIARWRADGTIEFLGRRDGQVKIRGFRVELGEIEAALASCAGIRAAAVVARQDAPGDKRLVAYVVTGGAALDVAAVQTALRRALPDHMVPSAFVALDALPLTPRGKIDRSALPAPDEHDQRRADFVAPRDAAEHALADIFCEVLGLERVGIHDDFFALGGHSLRAMQVIARLRSKLAATLPVRALFEAPTVAALADRVRAAPAPAVVSRAAAPGPTRLSPIQEQLWFVQTLAPASVAYNVPLVLRLRGALDETALGHALDDIVRRHEILRATVTELDGTPYMSTSPFAPCRLRAEPVDGMGEAEARATADARTPFDLERGPLFRVRLLRVADDDRLLAVTMHHIVSDGWSLGVFRRELFEAYRRLVSGSPAALPELALQYADVARWMRGHADVNAVDHWRRHVAGAAWVLELPTDRTRPPVQTYAGARERFTLPAATVEAIARLCRTDGVTSFMTLFAAFGVLVHRYTGQERFLVGVPEANRDRTETEHMIGLLANTLPFATDVSGDPTFRELVQRVRAATLEVFAHPEMPLSRLVEALQPPRDSSRNPLVQVMFVYFQDPSAAAPIPVDGLTVTRVPIDTNGSKLDLTFVLEPVGHELAGSVEYSTDLFDRATIARFIEHFVRLVDSLVANPGARVADVPLLTAAEHAQLMAGNDTAFAFPDRRIHELVEQQVQRAPDAIAIRYEGAQLTYRELNGRANQLAHRLRELGVGRDVLVGLCIERSLEMLVGQLAILKAGGAFVPLDPEYPAQRLAVMVRDCEPPVIVTQARFVARIPSGAWQVVCLDGPELAAWPRDDLALAGAATDLSYGIYTSGSTGTPKCALVTHRGVVSLLWWLQETYPLDAGDRMLQKTPLSFDISIPELFWPLFVGACIVVAKPEGHKDAGYLLDMIRAEAITAIDFVPSLLGVLVDEPGLAACSSLRRVFACGEALPYDLQVRFYERCGAELHNLYGPTETTVYSSHWPCPRIPRDRTVPIGRPVANTQLHVLDQRRRPVPIGVCGELYIGGVGLARGYLNRPELTAERFVTSPFDAAARLYRTGDLARVRADGNLEYLGRTDHQVKINGNRVELGEIEACLRDDAAVREVVVVAREDKPGHKRLVAYVVAAADTKPDALRDTLRAWLPDYMIPAAFVMLEAMPLNTNGKIDRGALPVPEQAARTQPIVAPRTPVEELIADIWREVLGVDVVGVRDNFFDIGGHSLLTAQVVARIRRSVAVDVPLPRLLAATTIEDQARVLERGTVRVEPSDRHARAIRRSDRQTRAMATQEWFWYLRESDPDPSSYATQLALTIAGPLDRGRLRRAVEDTVAAHDIFRTAFREIDGRLFQVVASDAPRCELEIVDHGALPDAARTAEVNRSLAAFTSQLDLATGVIVRARLLGFGPDRHALVVVASHAMVDGVSRFMLEREIFQRYRRDAELGQAASAYFDYADAFDRFTRTPAGRERCAWWQDWLRGASPLALPYDFPRDAVDARRAAARYGIIAEPMYPMLSVEVPTALREAITRVGTEHDASASEVYLATFLRLLQQLAHQDDICIESVYDARVDPEVEPILGPIATWTNLRFDLSSGRSLRDTLAVVKRGTQAGYSHTPMPDQFASVPAAIRGTCFNYFPRFNFRIAVDDLEVTQLPSSFPLYKRHWDLLLGIHDSPRQGILNWTGNRNLWRQDTIRDIAQRYLVALQELERL